MFTIQWTELVKNHGVLNIIKKPKNFDIKLTSEGKIL